MTTVERLSKHVYLFDQKTSTMRVRGAAVLGENKAVIFDTLVLAQELTEVRELCGDRDVIIVYSHADWDHIWGTQAFDYCEVIGHEACAARFANPDDAPATLKAYQEQDAIYKDINLIAPTKTFEQKMTLELGGLTVELSYLPGHSLDGVVAFIPEDGVLLAGDAVETALPVINDDSPLTQWTTLLENWAADERVKTVVPSHGEIQGRELLGYNAAYLKAVQAGQPFDVPYDMDDFYTETHRRNQTIAPKLK